MPSLTTDLIPELIEPLLPIPSDVTDIPTYNEQAEASCQKVCEQKLSWLISCSRLFLVPDVKNCFILRDLKSTIETVK